MWGLSNSNYNIIYQKITLLYTKTSKIFLGLVLRIHPVSINRQF